MFGANKKPRRSSLNRHGCLRLCTRSSTPPAEFAAAGRIVAQLSRTVFRGIFDMTKIGDAGTLGAC